MAIPLRHFHFTECQVGHVGAAGNRGIPVVIMTLIDNYDCKTSMDTGNYRQSNKI